LLKRGGNRNVRGKVGPGFLALYRKKDSQKRQKRGRREIERRGGAFLVILKKKS